MANTKKNETLEKKEVKVKKTTTSTAKVAKAPAKTAVKSTTKAPAKTTSSKAKVLKNSKPKTYATGKRKNAIAKVSICEGQGNIVINGKPASDYLQRDILNVIIQQPFEKTETMGKFDVFCSVVGGGLSGQAGAIKHGISKALQLLNPALRATLKSAGFLTRDSRIVERKKAGLKGARKGQVYQKR